MSTRIWTLSILTLMSSMSCRSSTAVLDRRDIKVSESGPARVWASSDTLTDIRDLAIQDDGSVLVLNRAAPFFMKFGSNGTVERAWGNRGGGPGEFLSPEGLVAVSGGRVIWTRDQAKGGFFTLSPSGGDPAPVRIDTSIRLVRVGFQIESSLWSSPSDSGVYLARGPEAENRQAAYRAEIIEVRADGTFQSKLNLAGLLGDPTIHFPGVSEFLPAPLWAVCPDRTIAVYDPTANIVRQYGASGTLSDTIRLPSPQQVEITFERVFALMFEMLRPGASSSQVRDTAQFREGMQKAFEQERPRIAKYFPEYFDLRCDPDSRLWIQPFDHAAGDFGRGPIWYRIRSDAAPTGVKLPGGFRSLEFGKERIWGVHRDQDGAPSIAWVKLP